MSISKEYKAVLRRRAIQSFIEETRRSPTTAELNQLVLDTETKYYSVDEVGISGFDLTKPKFRQSASASNENANRSAVMDDLLTLNTKLDNLVDREESAYRGALSTISRTNKTLDELSERLDNLLLIYGQDDIFLHGIEETFSHQLYIDKFNSTVSIEPNSCTLGKRRLDDVDLSQVKVRTFVVSQKGHVAFEANSAVKSLLENDGNVWRGSVTTTYQIGRVSLVLELTLPQAINLTTMKMYTLPVEVNRKCTLTVFYSTNGSTFDAILPAEIALDQANIVPLNLIGVKKLQIMISKEAADVSSTDISEYKYQFLIDKITLEASSFEVSDRSVLLAGPYALTDTNGMPVFFTKATLKACTIEPTGTAVAFYLSADGEQWHSVDHYGKAGAFVSFGDGTSTQATAFIDSDVSPNALVETLDLTEDYDTQREAYLNVYVTEEFAELVPKRNIIVKRNIVLDSSPAVLLDTTPGWVREKRVGTYSTVLYISNPEGRYIDFGPKGAILNGQKVTGNTYIQSGYSTFQTDTSNWLLLDETLTAETALKAVDPLYPYNHKYLIEGYPYTGAFVGERPYSGVDEYFGALLDYISPEEFYTLAPKDPRYFKVFTIEEVDGKLFFKVKVHKASSTWRDEAFAIDFQVQSSRSNDLYVKAVLSSNRDTLTPVIQSFKVRVV